MKLLQVSILACAFAIGMSAGPVFQVDYNLNLGGGTLNGNDLTSVMIMEADGLGGINLDFPFTIPGSGTSVLTHTAPFLPTSSLIVGLDLPSTTGGDLKTHIVFFTNNAFANSASGNLFSVVFPNTRHNNFIDRLQLAQGGDATQIAWLTNFFVSGDGASAAFATGTSPAAIEFTIAVPLATPEPRAFALVALGLVGILARRRTWSA